jgi:hypothetical protein
MPPTGPAPPRVSRETRLLLVTALVSLVALWGLARVRFPDRAVSPNPLPPVLTQLAPRSPFDEIPALIAELTPRLAGWVAPVVYPMKEGSGHMRAALRVGENVAVILLDDAMIRAPGLQIVARDPLSGIALVQVPPQSATDPVPWSPRRPDLPRYLVAADVVEETVSFRPVFVGPLIAAPSEVWLHPLWLLPERTDLMPGELMFSIDGAFAGLVVTHDARAAIVPAPGLLALADRLMGDPPGPSGHLGVQVQTLTESIGAATRAPFGVIVVHVEPESPAAPLLEVTDVIEAVDGSPVATIDAWRARVGRVPPGTTLGLRVHRAGAVHEIQVAAGAMPDWSADLPLGLTMRTVAGVGVEVIRVEAGSSAALAGIEAGDLITVFNSVRAPGAAQLARAFASAPADGSILVAITRGDEHRVRTMKRHR